MACCLTAPSHYQCQCVDLPSLRHLASVKYWSIDYDKILYMYIYIIIVTLAICNIKICLSSVQLKKLTQPAIRLLKEWQIIKSKIYNICSICMLNMLLDSCCWQQGQNILPPELLWFPTNCIIWTVLVSQIDPSHVLIVLRNACRARHTNPWLSGLEK